MRLLNRLTTLNSLTTLTIIYRMFIIIFKWLNPLYILATPVVYIARLCHQVPILLNVRARTLNKQSINYNKYNTLTLPSDSNFIQDRWQSFQYIEWRFSEVCSVEKYMERADKWSMKNFKCNSNFVK